ncbi:translesion error-prone DNA polymerase V autoproteolytic subunit [Psychrobacter sp.]|uniref:translesion error-prone DNA polymerase V autoproteolytic subunit n=1 Tax=Psychrobacter sp. TaxID=56811 RepID=UPI0025D886B8|nr:translesion error-prone DNA polymerase V autoproteolytic subunit [Psychrobacter sp.]
MKTKILGKLTPKSYKPLPYFIEKVPAGFPSPAAGYVESSIDLNELCINHPNATFLVRVGGVSMIDAGVYPEDLLVVDRSLEAQHCDIIVCAINGEFTVKELCLEPTPKLVAYNKDFEEIIIDDEMDFEVFGVVINIIREIKRGRGQNRRFDF